MIGEKEVEELRQLIKKLERLITEQEMELKKYKEIGLDMYKMQVDNYNKKFNLH